MKNFYLKLSSFIVFLFCINSNAQTVGTLTFTFTAPKHTSGCYTTDCRYVLAAWIESGTGTFVKTKLRYVAGSTDDHLATWGTAAGCTNPTAVTSGGCNVTDATTGATLTTFTSKTFTWDGKNVSGTSNGSVVADGTYRVAIQETWGHSSATATRYFTFTKGAAIDNQTPAADANFTAISLKWIPAALATSEVNNNRPTSVISPNPSKGIVNFDLKNAADYITVFSENGEVVYKEQLKSSIILKKSLDLSFLSSGNYIVSVSNAYGTSNYKIIIAK